MDDASGDVSKADTDGVREKPLGDKNKKKQQEAKKAVATDRRIRRFYSRQRQSPPSNS